ncbi:MAG: heme o synthase [Nitrososphaerales archaeon]
MKTVERNLVKEYYRLTKPSIWYLLVFTAFAGGFMAPWPGGSFPLLGLSLAVIAVILGGAGCNTLTCYIDRDIDAKMLRTMDRPLPLGSVSPRGALYYGLILTILALPVSYLASPWAGLFMLLGILDNVVVYSMLLKRKSASNIILGGFSGGMPVFVGWSAVSGEIPGMLGLAMFLLVFIWIPSHIWSLSLRYKTDYGKVGVPMLPVVWSEGLSIRIIALSSLALVLITVTTFFVGEFGILFAIISGISAGILLLLSLSLLVRPDQNKAWKLFKFTSPYLALVFIAMMIEKILLL